MTAPKALVSGIHHVTALAKDPRENLAFYTRALGMRLVKTTVNFDDPYTYHLYYGDHPGRPGTLLTHFPHPMARVGTHGSPEIRRSVMAVPEGSLDRWRERLTDAGVDARPTEVFGRPRLLFKDPHGMELALAEQDADPRAPRDPADERAAPDADPDGITGVHAIRIHLPEVSETLAFLTHTLGFVHADTVEHADRADGVRTHLLLAGGEDDPRGTQHTSGRRLELVETGGEDAHPMGAGTVHHVAWRVADDEAQLEMSDRITHARVGVTPQMDRQYFRSIYFRIPGRVIFEIATDGPGFDVDEPLDALGGALRLPPQHEPLRTRIEQHLTPLD